MSNKEKNTFKEFSSWMRAKVYENGNYKELDKSKKIKFRIEKAQDYLKLQDTKAEEKNSSNNT